MQESRQFSEAATAIDASKGKWRVLALGEGVSKNGVFYSPKLMESGMIQKALPAGSRMMVNHDRTAGETGSDVRAVAGKLLTDPEYVPGEGMYANVQLTKDWAEFVDDFGQQIGLSINIRGQAEDSEQGYKEAVSMEPDPYNSLDLVVAPGAGGKFHEKLLESFHKASTGYLRNDGSEPSVTEPTKVRENKLDEKELKALFESALAPLVERISATETAVAEFRTFSESVLSRLPEPAHVAASAEAFEAGKAATVAGLSESAIKRVVEGGGNLMEAVAAEKSIRDEYISESAPVAPILGGFSTTGSVPAAVSMWAVGK